MRILVAKVSRRPPVYMASVDGKPIRQPFTDPRLAYQVIENAGLGDDGPAPLELVSLAYAEADERGRLSTGEAVAVWLEPVVGNILEQLADGISRAE